MKLKVEREIERINKYEKQWKIKTSQDKFKLIPIAQFKTKTIVVNGREINNSKDVKVLGLKLQSNGITGHVSNIKNKGNAVMAMLRFSTFAPKLKTTLVKTLLLPILKYPIIPLCIASTTQKKKLQVIFNKGLRFINCNEVDRTLTIEALHYKHNIKPLNITLHTKANKIWETIKITEPDHYNQLTQHANYDHSWFPKTSIVIDADLPQPVFTSNS